MRFLLAILPAFALVGCGVYDQPRVRAHLAQYLPEARCSDAVFELVEDDRGMRGDGPASLATDEPNCVRSIRAALKRRGSREVYYAEGYDGWNIPGPDRSPVGGKNAAFTYQGPNINLFTFRNDGSVLWQEVIP